MTATYFQIRLNLLARDGSPYPLNFQPKRSEGGKKRAAPFRYAIIDAQKCRNNRLTNNNVSKFLHILSDNIIVLSVSKNKTKKIQKGVSNAKCDARTQMAQARQTSKLFGAVAGAAMAIGATFAPANDASAQEATQANITTPAGLGLTPISRDEAASVLGDASSYARSGEGVAVIVMFGHDLVDSGHTPEEIGEAFERLFNERGVPADSFVAFIDIPETTTTFLTKNNSIGPYGIRVAMENVELTAREYQGERSVASLQLD